jgi:hypothetical protein
VTEKPVAIPAELIKLLDPAEQAKERRRKIVRESTRRYYAKKEADTGVRKVSVEVPVKRIDDLKKFAANLCKYPDAVFDLDKEDQDD